MRTTQHRNGLPWIIALLVGGTVGYAYWYLWGCAGACSLRSNPWIMTGYGMLVGVVLYDLFRSLRKRRQ